MAASANESYSRLRDAQNDLLQQIQIVNTEMAAKDNVTEKEFLETNKRIDDERRKFNENDIELQKLAKISESIANRQYFKIKPNEPFDFYVNASTVELSKVFNRKRRPEVEVVDRDHLSDVKEEVEGAGGGIVDDPIGDVTDQLEKLDPHIDADENNAPLNPSDKPSQVADKTWKKLLSSTKFDEEKMRKQ